MTILCINLLLDLRGIIVIGDRMAQEKNDNQLRIKIRKHQREKQKVIQKQRGLQNQQMGIDGQQEEEELNEDGDPLDDVWRSTTFTTQRIYQETVKLSSLACLALVAVVVIAALPAFSRECELGFFEEYQGSAPNVFGFINQNICTKCRKQNCKRCQKEKGKVCDLCLYGYYFKNSECKKCQFQGDSCLECRDENVCTKCKEGYVLREFKDEQDVKMKRCVPCPTEDGCDLCSQNICKTCVKGYFLTE